MAEQAKPFSQSASATPETGTTRYVLADSPKNPSELEIDGQTVVRGTEVSLTDEQATRARQAGASLTKQEG